MAKLSWVRVCEACLERVGVPLEAGHGVYCRRCGDALGMESARFAAAMGVCECTMCRLAPPAFDRAVSFANYDGEMRRVLHLLKFEGMRSIAQHVLGDALARAAQGLRNGSVGQPMSAPWRRSKMADREFRLSEQGVASAVGGSSEFAADQVLVVPVPLFATREKKRGYNQAKLLAEAAVAALRRREPGWDLQLDPGVLQRVRDTPTLYALDPRQRRKSLRGAFAVGDAEAVRGREVMLIDDIMTTGATARECARVLKQAGTTKVWVVTVARALPDEARGIRQPDRLPQALQSVAIWDSFLPPTSEIERQASS
ncbi:MAG: ComF family protein [Acidobacteriaceae bacterium]